MKFKARDAAMFIFGVISIKKMRTAKHLLKHLDTARLAIRTDKIESTPKVLEMINAAKREILSFQSQIDKIL